METQPDCPETRRNTRTRSPDPDPPAGESAREAEAFFDALERFLQGDGGLAEVYGYRPEELDDIAELGDQQLQAHRLSQAEILYEGCVILDPGSPAHLCRLGTVRSLRGDRDGAQACFSQARALSADPALVDRHAAVLGL